MTDVQFDALMTLLRAIQMDIHALTLPPELDAMDEPCEHPREDRITLRGFGPIEHFKCRACGQEIERKRV